MTQQPMVSLPGTVSRVLFGLAAGTSLAAIPLALLPAGVFPAWPLVWIFAMAAAAYPCLAAGRRLAEVRRAAAFLLLGGILLGAAALLSGVLFTPRLGDPIAGLPPVLPLFFFALCALCSSTALTRDPFGSRHGRMALAAAFGFGSALNAIACGIALGWFVVSPGAPGAGLPAGLLVFLTAAGACAVLAIHDPPAAAVQERLRAIHRPGIALLLVNLVCGAGNLSRWV